MVDKKRKKIDVNREIYNKRNNGISSQTKDYLINCFGLLCSENSTIKKIQLNDETPGNTIKEINIKLVNYSVNPCLGVSNNDMVKKSAECLNLALMPTFFDYDYVEVLQVGDGADFIFNRDTRSFTLESKGVNSKYNCPKQVREAINQVKNSFRKLKECEIYYGIAGESCYYEKIHYFVKINNKENKYNNNNKDKIKMNDLKEKIEEKSKLITKGRTLENLNKVKEAKESFTKAANKEKEIAKEYEKENQKKAIIHWISAISCAYKAEKFKIMFEWIQEFSKKHNINEENKEKLTDIENLATSKIISEEERLVPEEIKKILIKYLIKKNDDFYDKIRGKGNILTELYLIRKELFKIGSNLDNYFIAALNPIYNKKISNFIQKYIDNNYLIRTKDNTLQIKKKIKMKLELEKEMFKQILIKEYSEDLVKRIHEVVKKCGNLTSSQLEEVEKRELRISSYQYGRNL